MGALVPAFMLFFILTSEKVSDGAITSTRLLSAAIMVELSILTRTGQMYGSTLVSKSLRVRQNSSSSVTVVSVGMMRFSVEVDARGRLSRVKMFGSGSGR